MIKRDFHTHTILCDGKASAEEMVLAAIKKGMDMLGISGHAYTSRDETWCMSKANTLVYINEIRALQKKYADQIRILLGTEQDYFSDGDLSGYDYRIGSVHYVDLGGRIWGLDDSAEDQKMLAEQFFGGDMMALAEYYYETTADVLAKTGADVIGHFNLIEKFNENDALYDSTSARYQAAWKNAADHLLTFDKPFEINTGAISRGYRTAPYPSFEMIDYIGEKGGRFLLSSDSHNTETLLFGFAEMENYLKERNFTLCTTPAAQIL